jgi:hypothetical protein
MKKNCFEKKNQITFPCLSHAYLNHLLSILSLVQEGLFRVLFIALHHHHLKACH